MQSSMSSIMKMEENRGQKQTDEQQAYKRVDQRDRQGSDIFGWKNYSENQGSAGKKTTYTHAAAQNNGNLTAWEQ